ncbi:hypothetical protein EBR66_05485 [bacterium]|jgi:hypothetical protein|nr:hypothetical protein [bacterium]
MDCCTVATFEILLNGVDVSEKNTQADGYTKRFFPYQKISSVSYSFTRTERATLTIQVLDVSYTYSFPCGDTASGIYTQIRNAL